MVSTIQISEKTKEKLFLIKSQLELATGQKCTLEDAIKWLIARGRRNTIEERKKLSDELFGIAKLITLEDVSEIRKQKGSRFENI
ncbi:MAG TPA: hypothetical protein VMV49_13330 [Candidatus Deferrimicrobium sp.]|nr:hypothetical protein [Candidatus Deferrimicrobium sp.]